MKRPTQKTFVDFSFERVRYKDFYKRYFGTLLQADDDMALPRIGGQQSWQLSFFFCFVGLRR